jgi:hypothetical protein
MPTNTTDLMLIVAQAIADRDAETLEQVRAHVEGWLQTPAEAHAQQQLIDAAIEMIYETED